MKSTYTRVTASLLNGKTTHNIASLSMSSDGSLSDECKAKLQKFWDYKHYLVINEYSMIAMTFLVMLSCNISISKEGSSSEKPGYSFGGISIILCGSLHQIPPVAKASQDLLYQPINIAKDSIECQIRRAIFEEFTTVVILKEQIRVTLPPPTCHLDPNHHIAPTTALAK